MSGGPRSFSAALTEQRSAEYQAELDREAAQLRARNDASIEAEIRRVRSRTPFDAWLGAGDVRVAGQRIHRATDYREVRFLGEREVELR